MFTRPIAELTTADITALIDSRQEEGATMEFKEQLPGTDNDAKKEFAADVCALANSSGGYIVFGIAEDPAEAGVAGSVRAITEEADRAILRLENMLADTIEPRLYGVKTVSVTVDGGWVCVMQVPRGFSTLHRSKRDNHFYIRESRSKRSLDVPALTSRIGDVLGRADKLEDFFARRYASIATDTYPLPLKPGPHLVVHILPQQDIFSGAERDLSQVSADGGFPTMSGAAGWTTACFDGVLHHRPLTDEGGACPGGCLIFRSGVVEAFASIGMFKVTNEGPDFLPLERIEHYVVDFLRRALPRFSTHIQALPAYVRIALVGAAGIPAETFNANLRAHLDGFPRTKPHSSALVFPELAVESLEKDIARQLQPTFDRLWQSYGLHHSFSYQQRGADLFFQNARV